MKKLIVCLLMMLFMLPAGTIYAGDRAGAFSISPFAGGYTFDGERHLKTRGLYGLRLGVDINKYLGVEAVGNYVATEGTRDERTTHAVSYRLDVIYNLVPDSRLVPYIAAGGGAMTMGHGASFRGPGSNTDATANAGLGFKYFFTDSIAFRGDARHIFAFEKHTEVKHDWEYTAGFTFLFGGHKEAAPVEAPPAAPSGNLSASPGTIMKGESAALSWSSQNATKCEIQPNIGPVQTQGSMMVTPVADTSYVLTCDGPGGSTSSTANVTVSAPTPPPAPAPAPTPPPAPTSSMSVSPTSITQGGAATLQWSATNARNCRIQPDIGTVEPQGHVEVTPPENTTYTLTCTGESGTTSSTSTLTVTSPPPVVMHPEQEETVDLDIQFDFNKAVIKPEFYSHVDAVGEFMNKYPSSKIKLEGHTDNVGSKAYNKKLSQRRANAVKNYLVKKHNIDPKRITAVGYGSSKPIASNKTKEGRYKNRRVQAHHGAVK